MKRILLFLFSSTTLIIFLFLSKTYVYCKTLPTPAPVIGIDTDSLQFDSYDETIQLINELDEPIKKNSSD